MGKGRIVKNDGIFKKYEVYVICDEIWSDLILLGNKQIPFKV